MPKDYKDTPAPRGDTRVSHPLLLGFIIGLLVGIVISLAVALWLNRLNNPFVPRGRTDEAPKVALPPNASTAPATKGGDKNAKPATSDKAKSGDRPRFEFYQILPGGKEAPAQDTAANAKPATAPPPAAPTPPPAHEAAAPAPKPGSSPATAKPHGAEAYWLQAGAFSDEREADNLRAKIALTGLEASVRAVAVPDKGKLYRVRLGPYESLDDANRIKATLSQNGVAAAIIRSTDENRNP